jgi:hypothetical protein
MNYRLAQVLAEEAADTAATKTIDLNMSDPVSSISIFFRGQNSSDTPLAHPAKMVSKIEVVDGSDVLMSMSGMQAQALDFFHNAKPIGNKPMYVDDDWTRQVFTLFFGRFLHDQRFALDPTRFKNPQLKITHNKALGGSTCDYGYLQVWASLFDEKKITPEGFLMAKDIYSYALGNGTYEHIDLPTDSPYRMMLIRSLKATAAIWELYKNIKLSSDQDKHVILEGDVQELLKLLNTKFGPYTETIQGRVGTGSVGHYVTPTSNCNMVANRYGGGRDYYQIYQPWGGYVEVAGGEALSKFQIIAHGYAPHGALCIPFGDLQDPEDWFDVTQLGSLRLRILSESGLTTADTCDVVVQQLRKY